jgi:Flp pilus assembly protein protease CpaA
LIISIALLSLFFICTVYDLRDQQVPMSLTVVGLVAAGVYALFHRLWAPVILTIALILASDFKPRAKRMAFAILFLALAGIFQPTEILINLIIFAVWGLWEFGVLGGADVKLVITALLVLGNPLILIPISIVGGIQGAIAVLGKKKEIPFVASIFLGTLLFVLYPYL